MGISRKILAQKEDNGYGVPSTESSRQQGMTIEHDFAETAQRIT
jgi:hypothetical protein